MHIFILQRLFWNFPAGWTYFNKFLFQPAAVKPAVSVLIRGEIVQRIRKLFFTLAKLAVTAAVIFLLVGKLGWEDIIATTMQAKPVWLVSGLLVFLASGFLGVVQWRILLKNRGIPLPFGRSFRLYFVGMFFNNFMTGGIIGDAVKVVSIKSRDGKGMAGLAATFLDRFAGLWAMSGFAIIGSIILLARGSLSSGKIGTAVISLAATFLLFAGIMAFLVSKPLQNLFFKITGSFKIFSRFKVDQIISEMLLEAHDVHVIGKVALLSALIQLLRIGVHALVAGSLGMLSASNFHYFFIFVPIVAMLMTIPLPFGIREAAGGALFTLAGFPMDAAFVMGFLATLVGLAASMVGGLFFITDKIVVRGNRNEENLDCSTAV